MPFTITVLVALCAVSADGEVERTCGKGLFEAGVGFPPHDARMSIMAIRNGTMK